MIDLHCHSHYSDGALSPADLLQKAVNNGIKYLSLTDHDTIAGYEELNKAAANQPITIIQGIELSTRWKKHDLHILGYHIKATDELHALIANQNQSRIDRAKAIGVALEKIGIEDAYNRACVIAGHERVGRPHYAQLLIQQGMAKDMKAAFTQYLGRGKKAFVPTPWISVSEACAGIVQAGGQAVIAHPYKYGLTRAKLHELIVEFKEAGGIGMEVVSGEMTVSQINELAATCLRFHLLASSGSDFHSDTVSHVGLGRQQKLPVHCTPIWQSWNDMEQGTL